MPRLFFCRRALPTLAFSLFTAAAAAQSPSLDFDDALRRAAEQAPALRAQEAAAGAARERAVAAAQLPDPMLRLGVSNVPIDGPDRFSLTRDFMTMRNIGLAREFTREDKRRARAAGFEAEAGVALAQRDERQAALQQATALAWLERHDLERLQSLIERQRDEARLLVEAVEAAFRGGRGSAVDALAARSEVAALDDRLFGVKARVAQAQATLERYVGADAARRALGQRPDVSRVATPRAGEAGLETTPMLATLGREVARAEADVATARSERRGDWSAEADVQPARAAVLEHAQLELLGAADHLARRQAGPRSRSAPRRARTRTCRAGRGAARTARALGRVASVVAQCPRTRRAARA